MAEAIALLYLPRPYQNIRALLAFGFILATTGVSLLLTHYYSGLQ